MVLDVVAKVWLALVHAELSKKVNINLFMLLKLMNLVVKQDARLSVQNGRVFGKYFQIQGK